MIEIELESDAYPGLIVQLDDEDYADVAHRKWFPVRSQRTFYAYDGKGGAMHQLILPGVTPIDHRDGNGLNNQKSNLRGCTHQQNMQNKRLPANNTSGYKGVRWYKRTGRWIAGCKMDGRLYHLGYFDDPIEAAKAYDAKALELFGEFARLNFPEGHE